MNFLREHPQLIVLALLVVAAVVAVAVSIKFPPFGAAMKRIFRQPTFMAAFIVLVIAALGLNFAVDFMKLHFKKQPVPLARKLTLVPDRFGPWVQVMADKAIDSEIQDVLGTDQYIFREYVDERLAGSGIAEQFKALPNDEERQKFLSQIRVKNQEAVISLSVTYYTGMVDTVAHVPDRCFVADGYEPRPGEDVYVKWPIAQELAEGAKPKDSSGKPSNEVEVHYINFEDQTGATKVTRSVAYFFHTNGTFVSSPNGVRLKLQNLFERHGYYAKVEVMTLINDPKKSAKVMTDFLSAALPEVHRSMPDWQQVQASERGTQLASAGASKG